jgi:hypothetical protein
VYEHEHEYEYEHVHDGPNTFTSNRYASALRMA